MERINTNPDCRDNTKVPRDIGQFFGFFFRFSSVSIVAFIVFLLGTEPNFYLKSIASNARLSTNYVIFNNPSGSTDTNVF